MSRNYSFTVCPEDLDGGGTVTIPAFYRKLISSIGWDIKRQGFGVDVMARKGLTWVLARCAFEFARRPELYEPVKVSVWSSSSSGLLQDRCLKATDASGGTLCNGVTQWCVLSKDTRRPVVMDMPECDPLDLPCDPPRRLGAFQTDHLHERQVGYSECDFNGHLNNSRYVESFFDLLPSCVAQALRPVRLDVHFKKEIPLGGKILSCIRQAGESAFDFLMSHEGRVACLASLALL